MELDAKIQRDAKELEAELARQGAVYDDPALTPYLQELGRRCLAQEMTQGTLTFDFQIVRDPTVNAYAIANGRSYYHMGLLAKMRNPDMLAAIMAHETSHIIHRDILYRVDSLHQKTIAAKLAELTLVPAASLVGAGGLASLVLNVSYASSVTGYGRDREAAADTYALERLQAVGLNPAAVVQAFEVLLQEDEKYRRGLEIWFLMDHPKTRLRIAEAKEWLSAKGLSETPLADDPEFLRLTDPIRLEAASLNIRFERYFHALDMLEDYLRRHPSDPEALALQAECYRRLAEVPKAAELELSAKQWSAMKPKDEKLWMAEWRDKAETALRGVVQRHPKYPASYRELGLLYAAKGQRQEAARNLETYLALKPDARDKRYITSQRDRVLSETSQATP